MIYSLPLPCFLAFLWALIGYLYSWKIAIEDWRTKRKAAQAPEPEILPPQRPALGNREGA
jgi:hypothetical protein